MSAPALRLLVVVVHDPEKLDEILSGFLETGITGATVLQSEGMGSVLSQESEPSPTLGLEPSDQVSGGPGGTADEAGQEPGERSCQRNESPAMTRVDVDSGS